MRTARYWHAKYRGKNDDRPYTNEIIGCTIDAMQNGQPPEAWSQGIEGR